MKDRIVNIIKEKNLTIKDFVEIVGIQRSTISHILSGRNNPSVELLIKILKAFPDINAEWLLTGNGDMYKKTSDTIPELSINIPINQPYIKETDQQNIENKDYDIMKQKQNIEYSNSDDDDDDNIEEIKKIIILYENNIAEVYRIKK